MKKAPKPVPGPFLGARGRASERFFSVDAILAANPHVTLALPDTRDVVIIEGDADNQRPDDPIPGR